MRYQLCKQLADLGDKVYLSMLKGTDAGIPIPIIKFYLLKRALQMQDHDKIMLEVLLNLLNE